MLTSLGFGPDTVLMNDPKLFVDGRFLASLLVELKHELGERQAALALFQIGLLHGLRDAARLCRDHETGSINSTPLASQETTRETPHETTPLVMDWAAGTSTDDADRLSISGSWPERHEAIARCSRHGPREQHVPQQLRGRGNDGNPVRRPR